MQEKSSKLIIWLSVSFVERQSFGVFLKALLRFLVILREKIFTVI